MQLSKANPPASANSVIEPNGGGTGSSQWIVIAGGQTLALLSLLLALATVIPVLLPDVFWSFVSGGLFGAVFLSVVASTTALVRHNLPPSQFPSPRSKRSLPASKDMAAASEKDWNASSTIEE